MVMDCLTRGSRWAYLSAGEAQAIEFVAKCEAHAQAIGAVRRLESFCDEDGTEYLRQRITFPSGGQISALPANPRTARGASANLVLDEFAHALHDWQIWRAASGLITRGYGCRIISTPNGKRGAFYSRWSSKGRITPEHATAELAHDRQPCKDGWHRFEISIARAKKEALPGSVIASLDLAELRDTVCDTEEDWLQEYCCIFLDELTSWLPHSLIHECHDAAATTAFDPERLKGFDGGLYAGVDVGRYHDHTVIWIVGKRGQEMVTVGVLVLKAEKWDVQRAQIEAVIKRCRRTCIDRGGVGVQLAEELEQAYPTRVERVAVAGNTMTALATDLKASLETRRLLLPEDEDIDRDLHSIQRGYAKNGAAVFRAEHTQHGHGDRFWAAALSVRAALHGGMPSIAGAEFTNTRTFVERGDEDARSWDGY